MAAPTITSVTPSTGHTGGSTLVELIGTGFRLPPDPPATGKTNGIVPETVLVTFGGAAASEVQVISSTRLLCRLPRHDAGTVDVVVTNLDDDGVAIPGETVTLTDGFTFAMPKLSADVESDLTRLVRTLLRELKRQVIPNVAITTHTDYDATTGDLNFVDLATLPSLVLIGPELSNNFFYSQRGSYFVEVSPGVFDRRRQPRTVDLTFTLLGLSDSTIELTNLAAVVELFFEKNKYLYMDRDKDDSSKGQVRYELDFVPSGGDLRLNGLGAGPGESNLRSFSGAVVVRGFDLEELAGFTDEGVIGRSEQADEVDPEPPQQTG